jgi:hypothetical protein
MVDGPDGVGHAPAGLPRLLLHRRPPTVDRRLDLANDLSSPRRARLLVTTACQDWRLDSVFDGAVIVASELVENAVVHARTACRLAIRLDDRGLTIAVREGEPFTVLHPRPGHGLFMVAEVSRAWDVARRGDRLATRTHSPWGVRRVPPVQAAGLEHFIPHVLRHTAAQRRLSADGSEGGLMAVAGWKRRDMLDRYTQATAAERAATEARQLSLGDLDYCSPPWPGCWLEPRSGSCLFNVRLGGHAKGVVDS